MLAVADGLQVRVVEQRAGRGLEEGGEDWLDAAFGHAHAALPPPRFGELGVAAEVGLKSARDFLFWPPTAQVLGQVGGERGGNVSHFVPHDVAEALRTAFGQ